MKRVFNRESGNVEDHAAGNRSARVIGSAFKLPAEGSPFSGSPRILEVEVALVRPDEAAEGLRDLIRRLPDDPAILPITEIDVDGDRLVITMPAVDGQTLDAALREYGPAVITDALPRLALLAGALDAAAACGVYHGALGTTDILVTADDTYVSGLGVWQAVGREAAASDDQSAFAAIAYEWLFGEPVEPTFDGLIAVPPVPDVDHETLTSAFNRALARNPQDRFSSCGEFVHALTLAAEGSKIPEFHGSKVLEFDLPIAEPVVEAPIIDVSPSFGFEQPDTSRRFGAGVIAVALVVGLVLGASGMWFAMQRQVRDQLARSPEAQVFTDAPVANEPPSAPAVPAAPRPPALSTPSPPRSDAAPAAQLDAGILVHSTPMGASVVVDGVPRGVTPLAIRGLELGTRTVVISHPGFGPVERQVTLTSERPSRTLEVDLSPAAGATDTPVAGAAPAPAAAQGDGALVIDSRPAGASVTLDGRSAGVTPLTIEGVAPGRYTVRMERAGYRAVSTTVEVKAGERARVAARLEGGQEEE